MPSSISEQLRVTLSGRYEIDREIGAGGMATVYLARDSRHERRVALKVLNPELGAVLGVERFLAEIRVTANLQHPNLLPLFDSGEAGGLLFYVMPFIDGESLRDRLTREKQLPIEEAIRIATAVAGALDYAHRHGVIHRDLKPENILLHDGQPVVADFGIALAVSNAGGGRITQTGLSLGTPQYMSPEQATGDRAIDGRTDIYSLAAVLYEMLAGEPPHAGNTAQAIIAKLMTEDPRSLTLLRRTVPPQVDAALRRALQKLPADRFATAAQFAEAINATRSLTMPTVETLAPPAARAWSRWLPWAVAAAFAAVAGTLIATRRTPPAPLPIRFTINLKSAVGFDPTRAGIAVAPDGSRIVYVAIPNGVPTLFARPLGEDESRAIPGTEGAFSPFFSPDGAWIGFRTADGVLKKVAANGGPAVTIVRAEAVGAGAWTESNEIVFSRGPGSGLWRVSANGGEVRQLTVLDSTNKDVGHITPSFLPGNRVLFSIMRSGGSHIAIASLDGRVGTVGQIASGPTYAPPSHLMFGAPDGTVSLAEVDLDAGTIVGVPLPIAEGVYLRGGGIPTFSISRDGSVLTYLRGVSQSRLGFVSDGGATRMLPGDSRRFRHVRVSPDGSRIAADVAAADGTIDVWVYEMKSGGLTRITFDGKSADPTWSPDGKRLAFSRTETTELAAETYVVAADGSDTPTLLVGGPGSQWPVGWAPDGRTFVYDERTVGPLMHISVLEPDGRRRLLSESPGFTNRLGAVSPNGRWVAYTSNESGRIEVFVRTLAGGGGKWQVSTTGGTQPVWSRDGKTLFYRTDTHIVAASVAASETFTITGRANFADDRFGSENTIDYDSHPNGSLAVVMPVDEGTQLVVAANWLEDAIKRLKR